MEENIKSACRGAVLYQTNAKRTQKGTEIDHCNVGGMQQLISEWRAMCPYDVGAAVIQNDCLCASSAQDGFMTFSEPVLSHWREYHAKHAHLQELSKEEHARVTRERASACVKT